MEVQKCELEVEEKCNLPSIFDGSIAGIQKIIRFCTQMSRWAHKSPKHWDFRGSNHYDRVPDMHKIYQPISDCSFLGVWHKNCKSVVKKIEKNPKRYTSTMMLSMWVCFLDFFIVCLFSLIPSTPHVRQYSLLWMLQIKFRTHL